MFKIQEDRFRRKLAAMKVMTKEQGCDQRIK